MKQLDRSERIKSFLKWLSVSLASRRGLPVLGAIFLTVISLIVHLIAALSGNTLVAICGFSLLHLAVFAGLIGTLLADPLGRG